MHLNLALTFVAAILAFSQLETVCIDIYSFQQICKSPSLCAALSCQYNSYKKIPPSAPLRKTLNSSISIDISVTKTKLYDLKKNK